MGRKETHSRSWHEVFGARRKKQKGGGRGWGKWQVVLVVAYGLIGFGLWSVLAIYGPVLAAEVGYQVRKSKSTGGTWSWLVPELSLSMGKRFEGYGIEIPKIYVNERVVVNVDPNSKAAYRRALNEGIAHAAGTSLPGDGGMGYYFAHSSGLNPLAPQKQAVFYLLGKLEVGDEVRIWEANERHSYKVVERRITKADDVSFLNEVSEGERIVLQTCWPIGTSLERLLIFGERV